MLASLKVRNLTSLKMNQDFADIYIYTELNHCRFFLIQKFQPSNSIYSIQRLNVINSWRYFLKLEKIK